MDQRHRSDLEKSDALPNLLTRGGVSRRMKAYWQSGWLPRDGDPPLNLVGSAMPVKLEVVAGSTGDLGDLIARQRFVEGRLTQPDGDGVLLGMLIATSRIQCVLEVS